MQNLSNHSIKQKKQSTKKHHHSEIISSQEISIKYKNILKELSLILSKMSSNELVLNYNSKVVTTKPIDTVRMISEWSQKDTFDLTIRNIILSSIISAENKVAGSGIVCAYSLITDFYKPPSFHRNTLQNRANPEDISDALLYFLGSGIIFRLMNDLIEIGGLSADLKFGYTNSKDFNINVTASQEVLGEVHALFDHKVSEVESPIIIAIDGRIDTIGEVDHILQQAALCNKNIVIASLGFTPDLVTTLSENWKSGNLKIIPYVVKQWDINGKLGASDICSGLGIRCISPDLGDVFSSFSLDDFSDHNKVYITPRGIMIKSEKGDYLCAEIKIPKRLKSLSGVIRDRCKLSQKVCIGIARSGICSKEFSDLIYRKYNTKIITSYASQTIGIKAALSCKKMIENMGSLIIRS